MDVTINSQIQSPLVRTLARTKGKSQSFTHNIADNVPPCSFTKIQIGAQNATETQFGRSYKLKIPQYGYLRDVILKYTTQENTISDKIAKLLKPLYTQTAFSLDDIRVAGSFLHAGNPNTSTSVDTVKVFSASDLSWYNCQNLVQTNATKGYNATNLDLTTANDIRNVLVPQFSQLLAARNAATGAVTIANGVNATNGIDGYSTDTFVANTQDTDTGGAAWTAATVSALRTTTAAAATNSANVATSYSQGLKLNGTPALWSSVFRLYHDIYQLSKINNGATYPVAKMVWEQLKSEPIQTINYPLWTTKGYKGLTPPALEKGVVTYAASTYSTTNDFSVEVECTLPKYVVARQKGGQIFWIPKMPQFRFDGNGTIIGVDFIPLDFIHPNDNDDTMTKLKFNNLSDTDNKYNFRSFAYGDDNTVDEDWKMWDWQTEAFYYQGIAANIAERVQLSTHNRPIQTVFPQEVYARIQKLEPAERARYLKMMKARVSKTGVLADNAGSTGNAGEKTMYFPLFLSSTENPSLNFDTRFVEQLDIDVITRDMRDVFVSTDVISQNTNPSEIRTWIETFRTSLFQFYWGANGPDVTAPYPSAAEAAVVPAATQTILADLSTSSMITAKSSTYATYTALTPRSYVLDLRSFQTVPANFIKVEALLYYHNFHDSTSQAIRDSNFKPGTPASLLSYNTYLETPIALTAKQLQNTEKINALITTNNLVFGTTFMVRRRGVLPKTSNKRDHYMQTLPIKSATLSASGQQLYTANLDEAQITDPFDYDLASGKIGRKYNNSLIAQSIEDPYTGESLFVYHIPFGFSSDMTYNSGSIAFQTLNNPVLTVEVDVGSGASRPFPIVVNDNDFELVVFHNYWQMIRIDSNTGAITRSLDL
jgi:hypothetical protein